MLRPTIRSKAKAEILNTSGLLELSCTIFGLIPEELLLNIELSICFSSEESTSA